MIYREWFDNYYEITCSKYEYFENLFLHGISLEKQFEELLKVEKEIDKDSLYYFVSKMYAIGNFTQAIGEVLIEKIESLKVEEGVFEVRDCCHRIDHGEEQFRLSYLIKTR